ncbi:zinc finger MYM-type protein 1-like [Aphis gossypii]|uniref:zinc finger MYM-type protein 1-like n=1 Tax=Aphis gossypii TaxID=80765 RepID=UPI0021590B98|nr:zinc finger MYM-type protein 1-like [Aphis gossypii]
MNFGKDNTTQNRIDKKIENKNSDEDKLLKINDNIEINNLKGDEVCDNKTTIQSDGSQRKFSPKYFYRVLANNEKVDRIWLVYSPIKDCVFCFCCKMFSNEKCHSDLATVGISDWRHLSDKLISHERSQYHIQSVKSWFELKIRIEMNETIDKRHQELIEKEHNHWKNVLIRILSIIQFLATNNDSFRGSSDVLYTKNNGKFLGLIEMSAKFDPVILEHVNRIKNKETHVHYLGYEIQDELIKMMAAEVKQRIIDSIKTAKYFSIIMNTTPDISHNEQLTILIRIINMDNKNTTSAPVINEYFLDFINVKSTTGLNLSEILISQLKIYNIDLKDCRGQAYDNGSNMIEQYKGLPFIINALEEVSDDINDLIARSEALSLLKEVSSYEFILSMIIWYDILIETNIVSKSLQSHNMDMCVSTKLVFGLLEYLKNYREKGYELAKNKSNELANLAIKSLDKRFKQLESYSNNFGFLYRIGKLKAMQDDELMKYCKDLHMILSDECSKDIDGQDLFAELLIFRTLVDEEITPLQALSELKNTNGSFPNITIPLRIMLTIPVTSA